MDTPPPTSSAPDLADPQPPLPEHYFDLYNLAVEMADRISSRRVLANSFFATANTGLVVLLGGDSFPWYVSAAGIVLAFVWLLLLRSYRRLNKAKYDVILKMEKRLPVRVFGDEWDILKGESTDPRPRWGTMRTWLTQYWELGTVEKWVPLVFALIYVIDVIYPS